MSAVVLRRIDAAQNMARFYRLDVQPDLFGGWSFIREWGRIGRPGTVLPSGKGRGCGQAPRGRNRRAARG